MWGLSSDPSLDGVEVLAALPLHIPLKVRSTRRGRELQLEDVSLGMVLETPGQMAQVAQSRIIKGKHPVLTARTTV